MHPDISRFAADGQDTGMVAKLLARAQEICTSAETPLYMAVQQKPVANFAPDAVVLTNRRFIFFRQKMLGRMDFIDCIWMHVANVHMKENLVGATITLRGQSGRVECIDYLPKIQARRVYRVAQEMEEKMIEFRRDRMMEEQRNAANQVVVQNAIAPNSAPSPAPAQSGSDPVVKLQQIKQMLDAGLIEQEEYDRKKASILETM
ncbi:PH domain-containing protein [Roseimaritima sediminicola]|uniref:PH domain-containing protein n=1 Tax=Roseimaritima sediminicola TaxID=2662066 RepID=UPI001386A3AB|nr:PH domain-containing protein [Roseimaritima sediminicola]